MKLSISQTTTGGGESELRKLLASFGRCYLHSLHGLLYDTGVEDVDVNIDVQHTISSLSLWVSK